MENWSVSSKNSNFSINIQILQEFLRILCGEMSIFWFDAVKKIKATKKPIVFDIFCDFFPFTLILAKFSTTEGAKTLQNMSQGL